MNDKDREWLTEQDIVEEREEDFKVIVTIMLAILAAPIAILAGIGFYLLFLTEW